MCPERIKGERYNAQSDIWSAGLTFCEGILGYYPYKNQNSFMQLLMEITKVQNFEFPPGTSDNCKDFILSCLKQKPEERPTAQALLEHPFLIDHANVTQADVAQWLSTVDIVPEESEQS
jgi:serine/threonine protein kinase